MQCYTFPVYTNGSLCKFTLQAHRSRSLSAYASLTGVGTFRFISHPLLGHAVAGSPEMVPFRFQFILGQLLLGATVSTTPVLDDPYFIFFGDHALAALTCKDRIKDNIGKLGSLRGFVPNSLASAEPYLDAVAEPPWHFSRLEKFEISARTPSSILGI
ncbi:hypothetical protein EI94DRAFT_1729328 [Lactarius quietus]|nr:hypothetical protein EI94DRAFT_1729328 [Lactarius quietus]